MTFVQHDASGTASPGNEDEDKAEAALTNSGARGQNEEPEVQVLDSIIPMVNVRFTFATYRRAGRDCHAPRKSTNMPNLSAKGIQWF